MTDKSVLVVTYPNDTFTVEILPTDRAVAWADKIAADDRASKVCVVFPDLQVSVLK